MPTKRGCALLTIGERRCAASQPSISSLSESATATRETTVDAAREPQRMASHSMDDGCGGSAARGRSQPDDMLYCHEMILSIVVASHVVAVYTRSALTHSRGQTTVRVRVACGELSTLSRARNRKLSSPQTELFTYSVAEGRSRGAVIASPLASRSRADVGSDSSSKMRLAAGASGGLSASIATSVTFSSMSTATVKTDGVGAGTSLTGVMSNEIVPAADERKRSPGQSDAWYVKESAPLALASGT
mmetsp:Transcript_47245/g.131336  ORF Transcript_47245/g.131336 Transcript_47245/m.131336 type:complete len:246 (+) Transcript_47245:256-993(+)